MKNYVNLLPLKHRRAVLLRRLAMRWSAILLVATALFTGLFWVDKRCHDKTEAEVSAAEVSCKPIITSATANKRMRNEVRRFQHRETLVGQLRDDKPALCFLALISESARACEGRIVIRDLRFQQHAGAGTAALDVVRKGAKSSLPSGAEAELTIEGDALDNLAIARFAAALRDAVMFRDVELKLSVGNPSSDRPLHSFLLRCEI